MPNNLLHPENQPIGIFDSGIGGLTLAHVVTQLLPKENFIYFGDTAHLPYGDKSTAAIQAYSVKICEVLLRHKVKAILIACHSASAAAFELVREYAGSKAIVVNVIDPVVNFLGTHYPNGNIGLIGTRQTVGSNVYQKKIDNLDKGITLNAMATPLLAPMIEEGFFNNNISYHIVHEYLNSSQLSNIDALVLACTHYPLIKTDIADFYGGKIPVIDPAELVVRYLKKLLEEKGLINKENGKTQHRFFVSDYTKSFADSTRLFFTQTANLEHYPLWD